MKCEPSRPSKIPRRIEFAERRKDPRRRTKWSAKPLTSSKPCRLVAQSNRKRGCTPLSPTFLLCFEDVVARRRQRQAVQPAETTEPTITTAERKAVFAHIRKMPPWRERVAHCMKQRQERATLEDSDETADESVSSRSSGGSGEAYDEKYEVEFIEEDDEEEFEPPFLADLETLLSRRQVRLSHRTWVETDPLQVMFTDFYKLMEDVVDGRQLFSS